MANAASRAAFRVGRPPRSTAWWASRKRRRWISRPPNIRVVAVSPAFIRTPLIAGKEDAVLPLHRIGRLGEAKEVVSMVAYLVSDEAGFPTGATYLVDGGYAAP